MISTNRAGVAMNLFEHINKKPKINTWDIKEQSSNARGQLPESQWPKAFGRFIFEENNSIIY